MWGEKERKLSFHISHLVLSPYTSGRGLREPTLLKWPHFSAAVGSSDFFFPLGGKVVGGWSVAKSLSQPSPKGRGRKNQMRNLK